MKAPPEANARCARCGAPVVRAIKIPGETEVDLDPSLEYGGNIEVRANSAGKLYAKVQRASVDEEKRMILHSETCRWRNP